MFGVFGGFLTYPLLSLVGNVRMLSSSASAYVTRGVVSALVALPLSYAALVLLTVRLVPAGHAVAWRGRRVVAFASLGAWLVLGQYAFTQGWTTRQDRRIADNPHWVLVSSWWQVMTGQGTVRMTDRFSPADLTDFEPLGIRAPAPASNVLRRIASRASAHAQAAQPPMNVILVVLESVAARWTSLNGGLYDTTPSLKAEAAHGLLFDNFYAHIGRSSNSLGSILLSVYPKLGFRDLTEEYPRARRHVAAALLRDRGYHTAFYTPSDLQLGRLDDVPSGTRLRRPHRLPPAVVSEHALVLGRRGPVHGGRHDRLHRTPAARAVLPHGLDAADAPSRTNRRPARR